MERDPMGEAKESLDVYLAGGTTRRQSGRGKGLVLDLEAVWDILSYLETLEQDVSDLHESYYSD